MFRETSNQCTATKSQEEVQEKENLPRTVTFGEVKYFNDERSPTAAATEAIDEARTLSKYKSDKEFLSKVLDA